MLTLIIVWELRANVNFLVEHKLIVLLLHQDTAQTNSSSNSTLQVLEQFLMMAVSLRETTSPLVSAPASWSCSTSSPWWSSSWSRGSRARTGGWGSSSCSCLLQRALGSNHPESWVLMNSISQILRAIKSSELVELVEDVIMELVELRMIKDGVWLTSGGMGRDLWNR